MINIIRQLKEEITKLQKKNYKIWFLNLGSRKINFKKTKFSFYNKHI